MFGRPGDSRASFALAGAAVLYALVLATAPFLPFVDLPQHVAAAQLVLHRHDPAVAATYDFALFPAVNVLGLFVMVPLHALLPETVAVCVLFAVYLGGLAWALARLGRAAGGSPWSAVLALVFALNYNLIYGFVSFCVGMPILVWLVARLAAGITTETRRSPRSLAVDVLLWWSLALAHVLLFGFALVALGLWLVMARGAPRVSRLLSALPACAWVVGCWFRLRDDVARTSPGKTEIAWHGIRGHAAEVGRALGVASASGLVEWALLACIAIVVWFAWWAERRAPDGNEAAPRRFVRTVALTGAVLYVALPFSIYDAAHISHGVFLVYSRFLVFLPLLWLPTLRLRTRAIALAACGLHLVLAIHWMVLLQRVGQQARGLDGAIAALASHLRVKSLIHVPVPDGMRFEGFLHVASLHQARARGETDQSFALIPANPIHYRDPRRPYLSRQDEHLSPDRFDWRRSSLYDAILVYDPAGSAAVPFPFVYDQNGWRVVAIK